MAVLGCGFCGYAIRYHGEPEGTESIQHVFCTLSNWRNLEAENLTSDKLEIEHDGIFFYAWRCSRCETFTFFNDDWKIIGVYVPKDEFSSETITEPFEFGLFWDDFLWFDITENGTPASEVLTKYPQTRWLAKNDNELRIYEDEARTKCIAQFRRLKVVTPVTVQTMSLESFKKMLANWNDIEFFYHKVYYNFMRENDGSVNIWRGQGYTNSVYSAADTNVDEIINAKILDDGKSIIEAEADIML